MPVEGKCFGGSPLCVCLHLLASLNISKILTLPSLLPLSGNWGVNTQLPVLSPPTGCAVFPPLASFAVTVDDMCLLLSKGSPFSRRISSPFPIWALGPSVVPHPIFSTCSSAFFSPALHPLRCWPWQEGVFLESTSSSYGLASLPHHSQASRKVVVVVIIMLPSPSDT